MPTVFELREQICEIGRRMYQQGFIAANDGNITVKLSEDEILATPSGVSKGFMEPSMILTVDRNGNKRFGDTKLKPSSEILMHMEFYRFRKDVKAIVHAHPVAATAFAVSGLPLVQCVLPEIIVSLGGIPLAQYATPSTYEVPDSLRHLIQTADAFLLANHGVVTVGSGGGLLEAYHRLESVEHFAKILLSAKLLGGVNILSQENVAALKEVREKLGISGRNYECSVCDLGKEGGCEVMQ